jgi:flagellar M-ring protein FliF
LDFFIAYFLEYYVSNQGNEEFIIYSKNKDYDPFIEYLQNKNINVKRIVNFGQINENTKTSFKKNPFKYISAVWSKLTLIRKICFSAIIIAVIVGIIGLFRISTTPVLEAVYNKPITDENMLNRIITRLNQEYVKVTVTPNNIVLVQDEWTARRMRVILIRENLIPLGIDPWQIFNRERWTRTDMEYNINFHREQEKMIANHIRAIEGVDNVRLMIMWYRRNLFYEKPSSVIVSIFPTYGSDITQNRKKIEGIQKILKLVIWDLKDENIVITNQFGLVLNDFEDVTE